MADTSRPADKSRPAADTPTRKLPNWAIAAVVAALVLWQVIACFRMFNAAPPPAPSVPISKDLAGEMRSDELGAFDLLVQFLHLVQCVESVHYTAAFTLCSRLGSSKFMISITSSVMEGFCRIVTMSGRL